MTAPCREACCSVTPRLTVSELKPQRTTGVLTLSSTVHNQKAELVLEGTQRYLLKKRPQ